MLARELELARVSTRRERHTFNRGGGGGLHDAATAHLSALNKSQKPSMVAPERRCGLYEGHSGREHRLLLWKALAQLCWSCVFCGLFASLVRRELLPPGSGGIYSSRPTYTLLDLRAIDLMVSRQRRGKVRHGGGGWEEP